MWVHDSGRSTIRRAVGALALAAATGAALLAVIPGPLAEASCNPEEGRAPTQPHDEVAGAGGASVYTTDDGYGADGGGAGFAEVNTSDDADHRARGEVHGTIADFRIGNNVTTPDGVCVGHAADCVHTGWTYAADFGVYQSSCYTLRSHPAPDLEYRPNDSGGGPCWIAWGGGAEGWTGACVDGHAYWGEWRECWSPFPNAPTRQTLCWNGDVATAPPNLSLYTGPGGEPCARLERPGVQGSLDVCLNV